MADLARRLNERVEHVRKRRRTDDGGGGAAAAAAAAPAAGPRSLAELVEMSNRALGDMPVGQHVIVQDVTDDPNAGQGASYEGLDAAYEETLREEVARLLRQRTVPEEDLVRPKCYLCEYGTRDPDPSNPASVMAHYGYVMILNYIEARLYDDDDAAVARECENIFYRHTWTRALKARRGVKPNFPRLLAEDVLIHMQHHSSNPHLTAKFVLKKMKRLIVQLDSRLMKNNEIDTKVSDQMMKGLEKLDKINDKYMKIYSGRPGELKIDMQKMLAVGNLTNVEPFLLQGNRDALGGATATDNDAVQNNRPSFGVGGGPRWEDEMDDGE